MVLGYCEYVTLQGAKQGRRYKNIRKHTTLMVSCGLSTLNIACK
jgi:hypothetical protein